VRDALDLTREIINFIRYSPKRSHLFDEVKQVASCTDASLSISESSLRPLCPTRWTVRTASWSSVAVNYKRLLQTMSDISTECRDDAGAEFSRFLHRLQSFKMFFGLHLALQVFRPAKECSKVLQSKNFPAADAKKRATTTVSLLHGLRETEKFDSFYNKCRADADELGLDEPRIGRKVRPPKRPDSENEGYHPETPQDKSR
jgi:hypothetical protein